MVLLEIIYNDGFDDILFEYLNHLSLKEDTVQSFSKFLLKTISQIDPRRSKLTLKVPEKFPFPFLIFEDPVVLIEMEILSNELTNYQFELLEFYRHVNRKI